MHHAKDGELYKVVTVMGKAFELRYGYYEDFERARGEPIPIYPDFKSNPVYTEDGQPFVTQMQEPCIHGESKFADAFCVDCRHFVQGEELIGICSCKKNRKKAIT